MNLYPSTVSIGSTYCLVEVTVDNKSSPVYTNTTDYFWLVNPYGGTSSGFVDNFPSSSYPSYLPTYCAVDAVTAELTCAYASSGATVNGTVLGVASGDYYAQLRIWTADFLPSTATVVRLYIYNPDDTSGGA